MTIDLSQVRALAALADELEQQGYSDEQVQQIVDREAAEADRQAQQFGHESAAASRSSLQSARGALNAEGASPGQEPVADPYECALAASRRAGPRGSQQAFAAGIEKIFEAAQAGDPRVVSQGVPSREQNAQWLREARERDADNRERTGWTHR